MHTSPVKAFFFFFQGLIPSLNSPLPSCLKCLCQSEAWCATIHMKMENEFKLRVNEISSSCERMDTKTLPDKAA